MRSDLLADALVLLGLTAIAVAVGFLFGTWWGVLAGGVAAVVVAVAIGARRR